MNAVNAFTPAGHDPVTIRTTLIDGEPWFVAADVCRALGMDVAKGTYKWLVGMEPGDRMLVWRKDHPQVFCGSNSQSTTLLNEGSLYALISRSHKPEAKAFARWVTHEVLPTIRKTGGYSLADAGRYAMPLAMKPRW